MWGFPTRLTRPTRPKTLNDFVERRDRFKNELVIAAHLSTRYGGLAVERMVRRALPDMLEGRLMLWL